LAGVGLSRKGWLADSEVCERITVHSEGILP